MNLLSKKQFLIIIICLTLSEISVLILINTVDKYKVSLIKQEKSYSTYLYYYYDLDNDGNSEKLRFIKDNFGQVGLIANKNKKVINQWNFKGNWVRFSKPFIGDFDNDKSAEIFMFSRIKDSIYLHCIDPINNKIEFEYKAIDKVHKIRNGYDFGIHHGPFYDMDNDGVKEIYFTITTAYTTRPRNIYLYNFIKDTVLKSPESCAPLFYPQICDLDNDSIPEFFCSTHAADNCHCNIPYPDQYSWIMVFKPNLNFKFKPIPLNAYPAATKLGMLKDKKEYVFVLHSYNGTENYSSFIALIDNNGDISKIKYLNNNVNTTPYAIIRNNKSKKYLNLINLNGEIFKVKSDLKLVKQTKIPDIDKLRYFYKLDIDKDRKYEYIFNGKQYGQFIITRQDFKNATSFKLPEKCSHPIFSIQESNKEKTKLFLDTDNYFYYLDYKKSLIYKYWYLALISITFVFYFIFYLKIKIKEYRKLKFNDKERKINQLQIKSFQNQIDPHFTFNILESFGSLIHEHNVEKANYIFNNYAKLLKSTIINSEKVFISLEEELDFVKSYLDLEAFRYNNKFSYKIDICNEKYKQIIIPKMLVHIFVENAIKHGIKHLKENGKLKIQSYRKNGSFILQIIDNGIGREKAKEYISFSTGKG
ncbi:MAG: histidine kinase, partial [Bacteroidota bacterium]|nr:histidine kinase [Bacteroidota bacterium]